MKRTDWYLSTIDPQAQRTARDVTALLEANLGGQS